MKAPVSRRRGVLRVLLLASVLAASAAAQQGHDDLPAGWDRYVTPLAEAGETGWVFFPAEYSGDVLVEILDPQGYLIHLTDADDPDDDRMVPAGEPFHPIAGRWRRWLEGEWRISPSSQLVAVGSGRRAERLSPEPMPLVTGGRVTLAGGAAETGVELWLLHGGPVPGMERHHVFELSRREPVADVGAGVLMPAGTVLAGLWDRREKRYVALSSPFTVPPEATVPAPLGRPAAEGSWLLAFATLPHPIPRETLVDLAPVVTQNGKRHPPDATITTAWGVYAVWYGLAPGPAVLCDGNAEVYLPATALELPAGEITRVDADLRQRPLLDVSLVLPALVREKSFSLVVRELPEREELAREELRRDAGHRRFQDRMVHGVLEVVLETHVGPFRQQVDLTNEQEAFVSLEPELIEIDGTVRRGGEPHPATVRFHAGAGDFVEATADESGEYRVQTLQRLRSVEVHLDGVDHEPWLDLYFRPIDSSRRIDFDIPDADVRVKVVDTATRKPIAGAKVLVRNDYGEPREPRPGAPVDTSGRVRRERVLASTNQADDDGVARLPPPRPGGLEIHAVAEGYRDREEPVFLEIADPPQDVELEIGLEAYGETVPVRLLLPDGSPAAGAEVRRVDSLGEPGSGFFGHADAAGIVEVPAEPDSGLLLAKHPAAAFDIVDWQRLRAQHRAELSLPPAAAHPLSLRVWDPSGEVPAEGAPVAVWVGEHKLTQWWLLWLLDARPHTDENGFWTARNLPQAPVRVLVWSHRLQGQAEGGSLDALATEIDHPWPATVDLRAVR